MAPTRTESALALVVAARLDVETKFTPVLSAWELVSSISTVDVTDLDLVMTDEEFVLYIHARNWPRNKKQRYILSLRPDHWPEPERDPFGVKHDELLEAKVRPDGVWAAAAHELKGAIKIRVLFPLSDWMIPLMKVNIKLKELWAGGWQPAPPNQKHQGWVRGLGPQDINHLQPVYVWLPVVTPELITDWLNCAAPQVFFFSGDDMLAAATGCEMGFAADMVQCDATCGRLMQQYMNGMFEAAGCPRELLDEHLRHLKGQFKHGFKESEFGEHLYLLKKRITTNTGGPLTSTSSAFAQMAVAMHSEALKDSVDFDKGCLSSMLEEAANDQVAFHRFEELSLRYSVSNFCSSAESLGFQYDSDEPSSLHGLPFVGGRVFQTDVGWVWTFTAFYKAVMFRADLSSIPCRPEDRWRCWSSLMARNLVWDSNPVGSALLNMFNRCSHGYELKPSEVKAWEQKNWWRDEVLPQTSLTRCRVPAGVMSSWYRKAFPGQGSIEELVSELDAIQDLDPRSGGVARLWNGDQVLYNLRYGGVS
jgi:hypothetical protein